MKLAEKARGEQILVFNSDVQRETHIYDRRNVAATGTHHKPPKGVY
jgi:hypothetical protein